MAKKGKGNTQSPMDDDSWRSESDARTLIEAQTIRNDGRRYRRAKAKLQEQAKAATGAAKKEGVSLGRIRGR